MSAKYALLSERRVIDHAWGAANLRLRCRRLDAPRRGHRLRLALLRRQRRRYHHRFSGNCLGKARCTRSCIGLPSGSARRFGPRCPTASSLIWPRQSVRPNPLKGCAKGHTRPNARAAADRCQFPANFVKAQLARDAQGSSVHPTPDSPRHGLRHGRAGDTLVRSVLAVLL
jgi:hypothetical protein